MQWRSYPQPSHTADAVPQAISALATASTKEDAYRAYGELLTAVGRDHAGTYYPVVVPAIQFIGEIVEHGGAYARRYALEVLTDLTRSFEPEPGFEIVHNDEGDEIDLRVAVRQATTRLGDALRRAAVQDDNGQDARTLARELLDFLDS